jgi:hypothetical protein
MATWQKIDNPNPSTGPRTPGGKARSSQNALTHGLTAREVYVAPEETEEFALFLQDYQNELNPHGPLEQALANQVVHAAWNIRRIRIIEAGLLADLNEQNELRLDRISRYAKRFESTLLRCTRELRNLQSARAAQVALGEPAVAEAPLADPVLVERAKRTYFQGRTDRIRAILGEVDLEVTGFHGRLPRELTTTGVPRAVTAAA